MHAISLLQLEQSSEADLTKQGTISQNVSVTAHMAPSITIQTYTCFTERHSADFKSFSDAKCQ